MLRFKRRINWRAGQAMVEYIFIITFVVLGAMIILQQFGVSLQGFYSKIPAKL